VNQLERVAVYCGSAAGRAAAEVIAHFGARPEKDLREIVGL